MNILQINSSARTVGSHSTRMASALVERVRAGHPDATLTLRDLARTPHPALDEAAMAAQMTPADKRTPAQAARVTQDDALIAEIQAADVVVLGVPMYNFGVPAQLKKPPTNRSPCGSGISGSIFSRRHAGRGASAPRGRHCVWSARMLNQQSTRMNLP